MLANTADQARINPPLILRQIIEQEGCHALDWYEAPPDLPDGARVEILTVSGDFLPWQWPRFAEWHRAVAWRTIGGGQFTMCESCRDWTASLWRLPGEGDCQLCDECLEGWDARRPDEVVECENCGEPSFDEDDIVDGLCSDCEQIDPANHKQSCFCTGCSAARQKSPPEPKQETQQ